MIVSYKVAKYLSDIGFTKDCKKEYWNGVLHNCFDTYKPLEGIYPAPEILDAVDWVALNTNITIRLAGNTKGYTSCVIIDDMTYSLPVYSKPSDSLNSALELIASKALK